MITPNTFLSEWFSDCEGSIEIRVLPSGKQGFFSIDDLKGIDAFASKHSNKNLYLGVATRNGAGGTKANIINIPGAWADIDFKNIPQEKADKFLAECPLQPTFIVRSGGGYHCYWKFREPTDNIEIVEYMNRQLAQYFVSDPVHDATRILRLPNTVNHKYNPSRPVSVLIYNQNNQYNESDFEEQLPPVKHIDKEGRSKNTPGWEGEALKGTTSGHRHHTAVKLVGRYIEKGLSDQEILPIMQQWDKGNSPSIENDYGQGELLKIIQSIRNTDSRNHPQTSEINLTQNIRDWIETTAGEFLTRNIFEELDVPPNKKGTVSKILIRLVAEGLIERTGRRTGCFRRIEKELTKMDILNPKTETIDIKLPFEIGDKVKLMPGNVIVIAGAKNDGKTAFLLNVVKDNMDRFKVHYFNSEMGEDELKLRLKLFDDMPLEDWGKANFDERDENFHDVIVPGKGNINIVDYLEIYEDFWLVRKRIAEIWRKLNGAIAIVALQKPTGRDIAFGGEGSIEKARLALAMETAA